MPAPRARAAAAIVRATAALSRRAGAGGGSVIGGRAGLLIDADLLAHLGGGREVALVSGTNGKTTTTAMLAAALSARGEVATSPEGANMTAGLVSALAAAPSATIAALEVDEGYLPLAIGALRPRLVLALNLSRDQLDRVGEVRMVAARWRAAFARSGAQIVANADDPLVCFAARDAPGAQFVGVGARWRGDAVHCPLCESLLSYRLDSEGTTLDWTCSCGFARPRTIAELDGATLRFATGEQLSVPRNLPGRFNAANAAMAIAAASLLGVAGAEAIERIAALGTVGGRFTEARLQAGSARLLLAKNPAGWTEMLELVARSPRRLVLAINARTEDGQDPSWLWDVPFELLAGERVVASGERARDLALRLRHAGVAHLAVADPLEALAAAGPGELDFVGNYSAFQQVRRRLAREETAAGPAGAEDPEEVPAAAPATGERLRVVLVFPDLLGTYGDSGNARVLVNRARWRGVDAALVVAGADEALPGNGDLYLLGGAEDAPQARAAELLREGALLAAVERGAVVFGVCAGFQLLGRAFPTEDATVAGVGLLEMETVRVERARAVGEVRAEALGALAPLGTLSGFENHAGRTRLDRETSPLARVVTGIGNDEAARTDGAQSGRVLGTYLHGPALARNPALADHLLELALGRELAPLADVEELSLRAERLRAATRRR